LGVAYPRRVEAIAWNTAQNERRQTMKLAEYLLTLHDGICEVLILEERAEDHLVIDEAVRKGVTLFADMIDSARRFTSLTPLIIMGSAGQMSGEAGEAKLTGILYEKAGAMFAPLGGKRMLAISTSTESFYDAMQAVDKALPEILQEQRLATGETKELAAVKSATDAENMARYYVANRIGGAARIAIDKVTYEENIRRWEVTGLYRAIGSFRSRHFQLEVDADSGSVMKFGPSSSSWSITLLAEIAALLGALGMLSWLVYHTILR